MIEDAVDLLCNIINMFKGCSVAVTGNGRYIIIVNHGFSQLT